ncbi:MAG: hypothetical protein ABSC22_13445 [Roseiarcus sp.]|jgi:hypothetical protein
MSQPRKPNRGLQVALCAGVVAYQTYDWATATEGISQALAWLKAFAFGGGFIGLVGGLVLMARGK